jgi:hypothetical protein
MIEEVRQLLDSYAIWLKEKTDLRAIDKYVEITTPFLDRHNDHIQLYVKKENGLFILSDDGYTINDLIISGCDIDTEKRKQLLTQTLNGFGVKQIEGALTVKTDSSQFAKKKHSLLQAVIAVSDLFYTSSPMVFSLFLEDVQNWLDLNEIRYTPKVSFMGKSGFTHHYDFVIPKSKVQPERILQAINKPDRQIIENLIFSWQDTTLIRSKESVLYAILNDQEGLKNANIGALSNYGIMGVPWSERGYYKGKLIA